MEKHPESYVKELVANVEKYLAELDDERWKIPKKKAENPFLGDYTPEMDEKPTLQQYLAYWHQSLIRMPM